MKTIKNPITGEIVQIAERDFPKRLSLIDAKKECSNLGFGWRLPSKYEIKTIQEEIYPNEKENFSEGPYWTGSVFLGKIIDPIGFETDLSLVRGDYDKQSNITKYDEFNVRAVKTIGNPNLMTK